MLLEIKERLSSFGLSVTIEDDYVLTYILEKVKNHIKTQTNLNEIPVPLHHIAIDMVVGEFLLMKKSMGQLNIDTLDFGLVAKTIQDGDTTVTYAIDAKNMTPEASFNAFINSLMHEGFDYIAYRVLKW